MIHTGDCIEVMRGMPEASVDAIVTDPPYSLSFMGRTWDRFDGQPIDPGFMHWFAGFVDGEGCFSIHRKPQDTYDCQFSISLRADDRPILERIQRELRMGTLSKPTAHRSGKDNPKARFSISRKTDCLRLRDLLRAFPLRAKKAEDLELWSDALDAWVDHKAGEWDDMAEVRDLLMASRAYKPEGVRVDPFQMWCWRWGREALRVTVPGGYLLAFGGTRTHHRLVCGLEDAGWIIRDELDWIYASGFPKGKANLKPAHEPIVLARKPGPLRPLAIDACRIGYESGEVDFDKVQRQSADSAVYVGGAKPGDEIQMFKPGGRWPSNVLLSDPELFDEPNPEVVGSGATVSSGSRNGTYAGGGYRGDWPDVSAEIMGDSGGYSRFFIVPKADRADREPVLRPDGHENGKRFSNHPTVKPTDLMRHLVRLVTPAGGTVLDPFLGSGSTAIACELEGFPWIGIEKEAEYVQIAEARLNGTQRGLGLDVPAPTRKRSLPTDEKLAELAKTYPGQIFPNQREKPTEPAA